MQTDEDAVVSVYQSLTVSPELSITWQVLAEHAVSAGGTTSRVPATAGPAPPSRDPPEMAKVTAPRKAQRHVRRTAAPPTSPSNGPALESPCYVVTTME